MLKPKPEEWVPAFAGMTGKWGQDDGSACGGMTEEWGQDDGEMRRDDGSAFAGMTGK